MTPLQPIMVSMLYQGKQNRYDRHRLTKKTSKSERDFYSRQDFLNRWITIQMSFEDAFPKTNSEFFRQLY